MFDERMALKIRLEQLADSEERVLREFQSEREKIYNRLRELDESDKALKMVSQSTAMAETAVTLEGHAQVVPNIAQTETVSFTQSTSQTNGVSTQDSNKRQSTRNNRTSTRGKQKNTKPQRQVGRRPALPEEVYQVAIAILKHHTASVRTSDVVKEVEEKTGHSISNPTIFMERLTKLDTNVTKPFRGHYFYNKPEDESNPNESHQNELQQDDTLQ